VPINALSREAGQDGSRAWKTTIEQAVWMALLTNRREDTIDARTTVGRTNGDILVERPPRLPGLVDRWESSGIMAPVVHIPPTGEPSTRDRAPTL
jgi:hypothetical protein